MGLCFFVCVCVFASLTRSLNSRFAFVFNLSRLSVALLALFYIPFTTVAFLDVLSLCSFKHFLSIENST